jgi:hypothetical protein
MTSADATEIIGLTYENFSSYHYYSAREVYVLKGKSVRMMKFHLQRFDLASKWECYKVLPELNWIN